MTQQDVLAAMEIIDGYQYNYAYDASNKLEYLGKSMPGTGDADSGWVIVKFTYDSYGNLIRKRWAGNNTQMNKVWDNRASYF